MKSLKTYIKTYITYEKLVIFKFAIPAHLCLSRTGFFATVTSHLASDIIMHASCTEFVSSNTTFYLKKIILV